MKILFATGGTAGHINPALAIASYIREKYPESEIMFVGTADHMESRLVPNAFRLHNSMHCLWRSFAKDSAEEKLYNKKSTKKCQRNAVGKS